MKFSTKAIHAGQHPDPATGAIMPPVYLTSTYVQAAPGDHKGFDYSRSNHPTRLALEKNLAALEDGKFGLCFSSGLGAENTVLNLLQSGDHVVSARDIYGGTYRLFERVWRKMGVDFTYVDSSDARNVAKALRKNTRLVWVETPGNPLLNITDIAAVAEIVKGGRKKEEGGRTRKHATTNAQRSTLNASRPLLAVDNTFASPYLQQPLNLGADIVVHSTTKYLGGHSDVVGGAIVVNDEELFARLKFFQNAVGSVPGPLDCFLVMRGTKTLALRMERHCANAMKIAQRLADNPDVMRVVYPGLTNFPNHHVARKQMRGFGGMMSFELKGGVPRSLRFLKKLKIFALAESLGGVESLVGHPATMTHASIPREQRIKQGLTDGLIRLSVGCEDAEDLIEDLENAIEKSR
jgi:cystathionine beta-lyase/cystathionine gamma-synthase